MVQYIHPLLISLKLKRIMLNIRIENNILCKNCGFRFGRHYSRFLQKSYYDFYPKMVMLCPIIIKNSFFSKKYLNWPGIEEKGKEKEFISSNIYRSPECELRNFPFVNN